MKIDLTYTNARVDLKCSGGTLMTLNCTHLPVGMVDTIKQDRKDAVTKEYTIITKNSVAVITGVITKLTTNYGFMVCFRGDNAQLLVGQQTIRRFKITSLSE